MIGYVAQVDQKELRKSEELLTGDIVGKSGVERAFDGQLRGDRGWQLVSVNSLGRQIGEARVETEPNHGEPLRVTLDMAMQRELYEAFGDEAGGGIFLNVNNGNVLALVSTPSFDPNLFADGFSTETWKAIIEDPRRPLHDRAIASFYAPGSTFKVVMAVAGLETGTVRGERGGRSAGLTPPIGSRLMDPASHWRHTRDLTTRQAALCLPLATIGLRLGRLSD